MCSSPSAGGPEISSRCTLLSEANVRRAKRAAAASPIWIATIRSNATVMTAVRMKTAASDRVERRIAATVRLDTIRTAVTIRTPPRAASGIRLTIPDAR